MFFEIYFTFYAISRIWQKSTNAFQAKELPNLQTAKLYKSRPAFLDPLDIPTTVRELRGQQSTFSVITNCNGYHSYCAKTMGHTYKQVVVNPNRLCPSVFKCQETTYYYDILVSPFCGVPTWQIYVVMVLEKHNVFVIPPQLTIWK